MANILTVNYRKWTLDVENIDGEILGNYYFEGDDEMLGGDYSTEAAYLKDADDAIEYMKSCVDRLYIDDAIVIEVSFLEI